MLQGNIQKIKSRKVYSGMEEVEFLQEKRQNKKKDLMRKNSQRNRHHFTEFSEE